MSVLERAIKTFAEVLLGYLAGTTFLAEVNWGLALSASAMGVLVSVLINIVTLPPVEE